MFIVAALLVLAVHHTTSQELGEVYNVTVQQGIPATLKYTVDTRNHTLKTIRVTVTSPNASVTNPVLVSVNQLRGITSWQIPIVDQDSSYYEVSHTLCPTLNNPLNGSPDSFNVTLIMSTSSATPVMVFIEAYAVEDFILRLDEPITVGVTSSSPVYYAFHFTSGVERVLIKVRSSGGTEDICAVASMQIASCPSDGVNSQLLSTDGSFQSMRSLAAITTDKPDSQNFFYLVIAVFESSSDCRVSDSRGGLKDTSLTDNDDFLSNQLNRTVRSHGPIKNVTIVIEETLTSYTVPMIVSVVFFVVIFYGATFIGVIGVDYGLHPRHWIHKVYRVPNNKKDQPDGDDKMEEGLIDEKSSRCYKKRPSLMKVITGRYLNDIMKEVLQPKAASAEISTEMEQSLSSSHTVAGNPSQKRTAKDWMVYNLADAQICEGKREQIRYRRYCWHLFTIAVFYALPAFQLILTYQQLLNTTGNQDICYYNYLCSHKLGELSAFNNVWSNIGYVALGFLFILLAARRQVKYHAIEDYNMNLDDPSCRTGVPQHFGIYYTIGLALVAEGFLSAFYHVCPNDTNFQFDTAFMFIIAGTGIYQIFHNRHPEFGPNVHILYFSFALLIIVAFCGTLFPSAGFWIVMTVLYLVWTVFVSFQFYYHGVIKLGNFAVVRELLHTNYQQFPSKPCNPVKFTYVVLLNIVNLALAIYGLVSYFTSPINFNSFVLIVMLINLTLYLAYYVIVKCIHKENTCHHQNHPPKLFLYLIAALLCWIPAIIFFSQGESDWMVSPARSRDGNRDCQLMGFFNSHDIWHFLSAIALFFSLLMLTSLDDNQEHVTRKNILVF